MIQESEKAAARRREPHVLRHVTAPPTCSATSPLRQPRAAPATATLGFVRASSDGLRDAINTARIPLEQRRDADAVAVERDIRFAEADEPSGAGARDERRIPRARVSSILALRTVGGEPKLIAIAREGGALFARLAAKASAIWVVSAWASDGTEVARALWKARGRIEALVIGIDFHQTDPAFLLRFRPWVRVHEVADGTFHPKFYLFQRGTEFDAIVGSANFTRGGFGTNVEASLHVRGSTKDALFRDLREFATQLADTATQQSLADIAHYANEWRKKRRDLQRVKQYRPPRRVRGRGGAAVALHVPWSNFFRKLAQQQHRSGHLLFPSGDDPGYVGVAEYAQRIFRRRRRLSGMSIDERKAVAGLVDPYRYFGSMTGAGRFRRLVTHHPQRIDRALDHIPAAGPVRRADFDAFHRALPRPGMGKPAVGSRLLAMKRPDYFLCLDSANRRALSVAFGIPASRLYTYEGYWELLEIIWRCPWYKTARPRGRARRAWNARVALIDAFYYEPV